MRRVDSDIGGLQQERVNEAAVQGGKKVFFSNLRAGRLLRGVLVVLLWKAAAGAVLLEENFDELAPLLKPAVDESIPSSILGWTHTPPEGWSIDNSGMPRVQGVTEWQGWSFTTFEFWTRAATQERELFTLAKGVFAVADPDEWDDKNSPSQSGRFASVLKSPPIDIAAGTTTYLSFVSHYRQEGNQTAEVRISFDGGPEQVILHYDSNPNSDNGGGDVQNRKVELTIPAPPEDSKLVISWALFNAVNNWFWAIDQITLTDEAPPPPPPPPPPPEVKDWPTYMHDNLRSGVTGDGIQWNSAERLWVYTQSPPPRPAWPGPARWDAYRSMSGLKSMRDYDPVYHMIVVEGSLYFGSSSEDCVRCLDALTGQVKWVFFTDGPVRLPSTYWEGKLYFGSDDGYVYCISAGEGKLLWKYRASPEPGFLPSDGKLISQWPVRSGVLIKDGIAYFTASLLPWERSYLFALDAESGSDSGPGCYVVSRSGSVTMEGPLLASPTKLYVPQGRREPMVFDRATGTFLGTMKGGGGVYCLLTTDAEFVHGRGNKTGWLKESNAETRDLIATIDKGNLMVVDGTTAYVQRASVLYALDRPSRRTLWRVPCPWNCALIKAGGDLIVGGVDAVEVFAADSGLSLWSCEVDGRAYGLVAVDGYLYVSTDTGKIYCFGPSESSGGLQLPGDANQDGSLDISDAVTLLRLLFGSSGVKLPCEQSDPAAPGNMAVLDTNGDSKLDLADAVYLLGYLFVQGPGPALGTECRRIPGCPNVCTP